MMPTLAVAQSISVEPIFSKSVDADVFYGIDAYGNWYYVKDNVFFKESKVQSFQYRNLEWGNIKRVDIQNPLKIVLFFENFNAVVLLDNQLNEIEKISFNDLGISVLASAVGMASQNKLWVVDGLTQRIGLFDTKTQKLQFVSSAMQQKVKLYANDFNYFYWADTNSSIWQMSLFGNIKNIGTNQSVQQFQVTLQNHLFILNADGLQMIDLNANKNYQIVNYDKSIKSFYYNEQILAIFTGKEMKTYKIILP